MAEQGQTAVGETSGKVTEATMPEYLQGLNARPYFESLQKIVQVPRAEIVDMPMEQREVIAADLLRDGLHALSEQKELNKSSLMAMGMKWGVLSAIYGDFADRSTRIVKPEPITRNEEMTIDFMQGMQDLHPEIKIMKDTVAGGLKSEKFQGTKRAV